MLLSHKFGYCLIEQMILVPFKKRFPNICRVIKIYKQNEHYSRNDFLVLCFLSDSWKGFTKFTLLKEEPSKGFLWFGRRLTKIQANIRPENLWPEVWSNMGRSRSEKRNGGMGCRNPKLGSARRQARKGWRCLSRRLSFAKWQREGAQGSYGRLQRVGRKMGAGNCSKREHRIQEERQSMHVSWKIMNLRENVGTN